ncbi:MAG: transposase [Phycisphaerae bacterium]
MRIAITRPLFAWDCLDDSPDLKTIRNLLGVVPDAKLLAGLRRWRGRGRDDYPVRVLWGVCLLKVLLRHRTVEDTLAELRRNPGLSRLIGIDATEKVPKPWNMSRFGEVLGREPHLSLLREVFDRMVTVLGEEVPDLGLHTAGDATGLLGQRPRSRQGRRSELPQPTGGRKEYTDDQGNVTAVVEWFGYKLHVLVDTRHEVVLSYQTTSANVGDNEMIEELVTEAQENLCPERRKLTAEDAETLGGRIKTLAYDKAADDGDVHEFLDSEGIAPVVQMRSLWKEEHHRILPGHDGSSNVVYDEAGTIYCYDKVSNPPIQHAMAYIGHEPSRGTLKYRCPAMHQGWRCPSHKRCNAGKKYGKTVRVKRQIDLRRFPPIPRATKKFERLYKTRPAVERVIARTKIFWGTDDGNLTGAERFHANVAVVMIVHVGLATLLAACPRWEGTLGQTRLSPIAEALREKLRL